ncbi:MAG: hypothetical protein J3T61_03635 [Candidatus Brocadiales bacterium]|nr:hypothetical protein [Candidatus Bathyanammoxibius sp.]
MRLKKLLPIAIGGGIGGPILIFVIIVAVFPSLFLRGIIMDQLEKQFKGRATAEEVSFSWKTGVRISNLFIQDEKGDRPILKVDSVYLKFAIFPLLRGKLIIERLDVNRPEMVIYRGEDRGREGPSLDGAAELAVSGGSGSGFPVSSGKKRKFPNIIEARISDGTFVFTDLYSGKSTKVENLNLIVGGIKPGGTVTVEGECDIIGGGGQDHAVISGRLRGYELASLEDVQGHLEFKSGFASIKAVVDLGKLDKAGTEVVNAVVKADFQKTITRLDAILALPDTVKIRGRLDSDVHAVSQSDGGMLLSGETTLDDFYLDLVPFFPEPIQTSRVKLSHKVGVNPYTGLADIDELNVSTDEIDFSATGVVSMDGSVDGKVHLSLPLKKLLLRLSHKYDSVGRVEAVGDLDSDMEISGTIGEVLTVKGITTVKGLNFEVESFKYDDPEVRIQQQVVYDHTKNIYNIKYIDVTSGLLALKLKNTQINLNDKMYCQGKLSLALNMDEIPKLHKLPERLTVKGMADLDLNFKGPLAKPYIKDLVLSGTFNADEIVYDMYKISKINTEQFKFEKNKLSGHVDMEVNGAPVTATVESELFNNGVLNPHTKAELHGIKVPVSHKLGKGKFGGLYTVHIDEAEAEGLFWNEGVKQTLTANGRLEIENGKISGLKVLKEIVKFFGKTGDIFIVDTAAGDFRIENQKLYIPKSEESVPFLIKGKPFDVELSGWLDFDQEIDYVAAVFLPTPGKTVGPENAARKVKLKITGTLSKPKARVDEGALIDALIKSDDVIKDIEGLFKSFFK